MVGLRREASPVVPFIIAGANDSEMNAANFRTGKFRRTEMGKLLIFDYSSCVKTRVYRDLPCIVLPLREGAGVKVPSRRRRGSGDRVS
jgi:hypothetical protein